MKKHLRHWYHLLRATLWLLLAFARAARYFRYRAARDLALPHPETLNSQEKRRLQHYFYGTTYLSVVFCALRGYPRSRREKHLFTNLAALAYFFDDLVDADDSGILWQDNPEAFGRAADKRGLALHFLHNVYRELPPGNLARFKDFMHRVFNLETAKRQTNRADSRGESAELSDLQQVTAEKGGCSVLLFRSVLDHELTPPEQEAMYRFGYLVQLSDDIFDLWHDRQAGIATVATCLAEKADPAGLTRIFEEQVLATRQAFRTATDASSRNATAGHAVHFIVAITRVCLRRYADLYRKHGTLPLDDRALLVVDMEKWPNRLRAMRELLTADCCNRHL